jgi:hypothetical protein
LSLLDVKCTGKQIVLSRVEDDKELLAGGGREADVRMADALRQWAAVMKIIYQAF